MKGYDIAITFAFAFLAISSIANAQFWFQSGARSGTDASFNSGASVEIQTVVPSQAPNVSLGFWVGESLQNTAFIQVGYVIENLTGEYPSVCTNDGCSNNEYIKAGDAEWFYEYFLPGTNDTFLGGLGPDGSAGTNGTFNKYAFYSNGNIWEVFFNGNIIGSVDLGASSSGTNWPIAIGEVANASRNNVYMSPVTFSNLSVYKNSQFLLVSSGFVSRGYGLGSKTSAKNLYGVKEISNRTNYFAVGSGLPLSNNNTQLWGMSYILTINSQYGRLSSRQSYVAASTALLSAPQILELTNVSRALFLGWSGIGTSSYSGASNSVAIRLFNNVNETANWQLQYFVNISSPMSATSGSGWYNKSSSASYSLGNPTIYDGGYARHVFDSWSDGSKNLSGAIQANGPEKLVAIWKKQYLVNATSQYGNLTGSGWYDSGSTATVSITRPVVNISGSERVAFISWDNGVQNSTVAIPVNAPVSIKALFSRQFLVRLSAQDNYGGSIAASYFLIGNATEGSSLFLNSNQTYVVSGVYYKGVLMPANLTVSALSPMSYDIKLPVYNLSIRTVDLFGLPVNASLALTYKNGSVYQGFSGGKGLFDVADAPFGYSNGTAEYFGIRDAVSTGNGRDATLVFISIQNIAAIFLVVAALAFVASRRYRRKNRF